MFQLCHGQPAVPLQPCRAAVIQLWPCHPAVVLPPSCAAELIQLPFASPAMQLQSSCDASAHPRHCPPAVPSPHGFPLLQHGTAPGIVPAPRWPPSPPPWSLHPRFTPHPLFARRPLHGASTPPRAPSPPPSPDAGKAHPPRARRPRGTGEPWGAILGGWRGLTGSGGGLTLPSPPGKTCRETPKSRPKPKCSRYRREKQQGGERGWGGGEMVGGLGGSGGLSPLLPLCCRPATATTATTRRDPRPLAGAGAEWGRAQGHPSPNPQR